MVFMIKILNFILSSKQLPKILVHNKSILPQQLSNDEKAKHQYYIQRCTEEVKKALIQIDLII
jgi:hypothetical protein